MAFSFSKFFKKEETTQELPPLPDIDFGNFRKIAQNEYNKLYIDFEELGGFPFLKTILLGGEFVKIKRDGCTVKFTFTDESLTLQSDHSSLESTKLKNSPFYFTEIDFEMNDEELHKIKNKKPLAITFEFQKKIVELNTIS